jgi:hypothetical protein
LEHSVRNSNVHPLQGNYRIEFYTPFSSSLHFRRAFTTATAGLWRHKITDHMMLQVEKNCQPAMEKLGYVNNQTDLVKTATEIFKRRIA